ncbi:hypothetical protein [Chryseobacterium sp. A321]
MRSNNGQFAKGNTLGGRTKGSKNKTTEKIRDTFLRFIEDNLERMQEDFDTLDAKDRFKYLFEMSKFILPSLKSIEFGNVLDELTEEQFAEIITKLKNEYSEN